MKKISLMIFLSANILLAQGEGFWNDVWDNQSKCNKEIPIKEYQGLKEIKDWMDNNEKKKCSTLLSNYAKDNKITYCEVKKVMECKYNSSNNKKDAIKY